MGKTLGSNYSYNQLCYIFDHTVKHPLMGTFQYRGINLRINYKLHHLNNGQDFSDQEYSMYRFVHVSYIYTHVE